MSETPDATNPQSNPEPQIDSTGPQYRVDLDSYSGPLDLLLYLIKKDEVDIYDIPIARIAEQYQHYVEVIAAVNVNMAGEFLVMAATLMEIKSRMLLPTEQGAPEDEDDPRAELVRQLLEYKRYRDFAHELGRRAQDQALKFARPEPKKQAADAEEVNPLEGIGLWELIEAFSKVLSETGADIAKTSLLERQRPIQEYRRDLLKLVMTTGTLRFSDAFKECQNRHDLIAMFIAALELIRMKLVRAQQTEEFGEVYLIAMSEEEEAQQAVELAGRQDAVPVDEPVPSPEPLPEEPIAEDGKPRPKVKDDFKKTIKRPDMIKEIDVLAEIIEDDDSLGNARERIDSAIAAVESFLKTHHDQMKAAIEGEKAETAALEGQPAPPETPAPAEPVQEKVEITPAENPQPEAPPSADNAQPGTSDSVTL